MAKRGSVDWDACEREYRTGTFSNRQLAEQFKCTEAAIRDRVKRYGWSKDLSDDVRKETNARLLRGDLRTPTHEASKVEDAKLIGEAADLRVEVVRQHRNDLRTGRTLVADLMAELLTVNGSGDEIEAAIEEETKDDKTGQRRALMLKAVSLPSRAGVIKDLSAAMKNLLPLERQAFSLDASGEGAAVIVGTKEQRDAAVRAALAADP